MNLRRLWCWLRGHRWRDRPRSTNPVLDVLCKEVWGTHRQEFDRCTRCGAER